MYPDEERGLLVTVLLLPFLLVMYPRERIPIFIRKVRRQWNAKFTT